MTSQELIQACSHGVFTKEETHDLLVSDLLNKDEDKVNDKFKRLDLLVKAAILAAIAPVGFYYFIALSRLVLAVIASSPASSE